MNLTFTGFFHGSGPGLIVLYSYFCVSVKAGGKNGEKQTETNKEIDNQKQFWLSN